MKFIVCLVMAVFLFGCEKAPAPESKGTPVTVGMAHEDAEPLLSGNGAMHMDVDYFKDTDTHILEVNRFPNGSLVLVKISTESKSITDLKVCTDPNQPTNKLMWKSVKEFYPGID